MVLLTSLLFFSVLSFTISLVSAITCDGAVGTIAAILAPHRAVRAFCSAQYPVPKATLTAFAPTRTIITTVSTTVQSLTLETTTSMYTVDAYFASKILILATALLSAHQALQPITPPKHSRLQPARRRTPKHSLIQRP